MESILVNEHGKHEGGRMVCRICGNNKGMRFTRYNRGHICIKWTTRITCPICKSTERSHSNTGQIIEQKIGTPPVIVEV